SRSAAPASSNASGHCSGTVAIRKLAYSRFSSVTSLSSDVSVSLAPNSQYPRVLFGEPARDYGWIDIAIFFAMRADLKQHCRSADVGIKRCCAIAPDHQFDARRSLRLAAVTKLCERVQHTFEDLGLSFGLSLAAAPGVAAVARLELRMPRGFFVSNVVTRHCCLLVPLHLRPRPLFQSCVGHHPCRRCDVQQTRGTEGKRSWPASFRPSP